MKKEDRKYKEKGFEKKKPYVEPKVIATYEKEELEETIKPHGPDLSLLDRNSFPGSE